MLQLKEQSSAGGGNNLKLFQEVRPRSGAIRLQVDTIELQRSVTPLTVKRCTCASSSGCPSHVNCQPTPPPPPPPPERKRNRPRPGSGIPRPGSSIRRPRSVEASPGDELKLSLSSLVTYSRPELDPVSLAEREAIFARWLSEKEQARRRLEEERILLEEAIRADKQEKIELERRNFESWLKRKSDEERKRKERAVKEEEERKEIEGEAEQRKKLENELSYSLWLKRAEQRQLEEQLRIETKKIREAEERRRRLEKNATAYERWLSEARNRQLPLPLNQGLDSLRASVSVSYVNPTPWEPNVKPTTQ